MKKKLTIVSVLGLVLASVGCAQASSAQAGTRIQGASSAEPLTLRNVSVDPRTFYPLQFDGYKDTTTISYDLNRSAQVTARVYNPHGSVIREDVLGTRAKGRHSWTWGGRKDDYTRVIPGKFHIRITAIADRSRTGTKTVTVAAPLALGNVSASPATFYPLRYDGYKDTTSVSYQISHQARVTARVYNSDGSVIREDALGLREAGRHSWAWGGRKNSYARVTPGEFRIRITATADRTQSATARVTVATGVRTATAGRAKDGYSVSSTATRRSSDGDYCYTERSSYFGDTELDCWGGAYAQANYHFDIPATAYDLSFHVSGVTGCCSGGTISKWGTRSDATDYRVSVKVTDWSAYDVRGVTLSYRYKYRV